MDSIIQSEFEKISYDNRIVQGEAYEMLMSATEGKVDWTYEVWDDLITKLEHRDNHVRAIAAQLLCNLAKSDPAKRTLRDFGKLIAVTRDERFVTARHCLLAMWKIGLVSEEYRKVVVEGLAQRFAAASAEKNGTLLRYDIVYGFRKLYDQVKDPALRALSLELIETETDPKYKKKYAKEWKTA